MEDDCDIIIIGAGIAGTACALRCARAGLSVLLLERAEIPGSKNLSGGRLYTHALAELLPQFHLTAPLERRITHESLSLLTPDGATTFSSLQPGGESWSVLRARFDPWLVAEAEKEGVECIPGATVDALYEENGRVCGVICGDDILRARYVVLAEGANSVLAERHGLVTRPAGEAMALGIKEVLSLETSATRVIQILSIIGLLALTALLVTNSNPQSVAMGIGLILLLGFTCYASRGLYWACPGEARTPSYIMGTTVGICSVIGFLPDVFVYPIIGHWQDTLPAAEAYRNMWLMGMAALAMVIVFTFLLFQKIRTADSAPAIASSK